MRTLSVITALAIALLSCSKTQEQPNPIAGDWTFSMQTAISFTYPSGWQTQAPSSVGHIHGSGNDTQVSFKSNGTVVFRHPVLGTETMGYKLLNDSTFYLEKANSQFSTFCFGLYTAPVATTDLSNNHTVINQLVGPDTLYFKKIGPGDLQIHSYSVNRITAGNGSSDTLMITNTRTEWIK